ncbi:hypothetical protein A3F36_04835 [Candidatus Peribacteria bacterium RIFCSPHIGHO2_12_FULL_55_11]|nr:MAG: hypothetical protein A3F36_04835 [Candidatus Peribacteria bacterium RIFCSPHIGHO2_12_FULL_55_11]
MSPSLGWQQSVDFLSNIRSKEECLRKAYDILTQKYYGNRLKTLTRIYELAPRSPQAMWQRDGFLHCTNFNRLLRALLLESGQFKENDIKICWTLLWGISPHQYMKIRLDDRMINVDLWAKSYGIPFGEYARGFYA